MNTTILENYDPAWARLLLLLGEKRLNRLRCARVAIFGLGAVGSFATEALARSGIGYLRLIDFDEVKASNLNRQLFALRSTLGKAKADLAKDRVKDIHPSTIVDSQKIFFSEEIAESCLDGNLDYVIDAIDSIRPKVSLIRSAVNKKIPIVCAMGAAGRLFPGKVRCTDISETKDCPLCRHVRKKLHRYGIRSGVTAVWSDEPFKEISEEEKQEVQGIFDEKETFRRGRVRSPLPSMVFVPATVGIYAAQHVVTSLLGLSAENEKKEIE